MVHVSKARGSEVSKAAIVLSVAWHCMWGSMLLFMGMTLVIEDSMVLILTEISKVRETPLRKGHVWLVNVMVVKS